MPSASSSSPVALPHQPMHSLLLAENRMKHTLLTHDPAPSLSSLWPVGPPPQPLWPSPVATPPHPNPPSGSRKSFPSCSHRSHPSPMCTLLCCHLSSQITCLQATTSKWIPHLASCPACQLRPPTLTPGHLLRHRHRSVHTGEPSFHLDISPPSPQGSKPCEDRAVPVYLNSASLVPSR